MLRALYGRLPEEVRRCLRPLNFADEMASFLPGGARERVHATTEASRRIARLARVRYPLRRLEGLGRGDAGRLVCLVATDDLSARYWKTTLFAAEPDERVLATIPAARIPQMAARLAPDADLSLWQMSWPICALVRGARVPSWLPLWLATDRALDAVISGERSGRAARKNDIRRVQRLGLAVRITTDPVDYDAFRRRLYEPYVQRRFGDLRVALPPHAFHHARRHGCLLLLEHAGRPVGGAVIERWGNDPRVLVFGVDPDASLPAGAILEACYYHAVRFAVERRFPRLSLGTCRPVLTDGVLRYKRKWGAAVGAPSTWDAFLLRYRNTAGVRATLTEVPLVLELGDGRLAALAGAHGDAGDDLGGHLRRLDAPGLVDLACLVDERVTISAPIAARHATIRVVPPGEVWPAEFAA